ncbi:MAG: glycosyltransferase [Candidatus Thorarchaeota archaeon]|nr:glycosyltransferase [Candidatus Thorarchaeota archaeon]
MTFFAKIVSVVSRRPLVFDAHISNYNTRVEDRKNIPELSIRAIHEWLLDKITCAISDVVMIDTNIHGEYFIHRFGLKSEKIIRVFVGVDLEAQESIIENPLEFDGVVIYFYGTYIPLQGIPYIIEALDILRENKYSFKFILIGSGQEEKKCKEMIETYDLGESIILYPYSPYNELVSLMKRADICLGIFGESIKARNVIPNKVYDYAGMNKIFISGKSIAMDELFEEGMDYIGCKFADSKDLAEKIMYTIENLADLKRCLNPIEKVRKFAIPNVIAAQLIKDLKDMNNLQ